MTLLIDKPILISPPFGHYYANSRATSVLGSYTLQARPGRGRKVAQFVLDNLIHSVPHGYRNRIGLRNPGVASIDVLWDNVVYSLVGLEPYDWLTMLHMLMEKEHIGKNRIHVELNVSCPNVHEYSITKSILDRFVQYFDVTIKLPPDLEKILPLVDMCGEAGVHYIHCSNTLASDLGGLSGYPLKQVNLPIVEHLAKTWPALIAGGGIYCWQDLLDYRNAGANYFSMGTICFYPLRTHNLINRYYKEKSNV